MVDVAAVPLDIWPVLWPVIVGGTLTLIAPAVGFLWARLSARRSAKIDAAHVALCAALALERFAVICWPVSYSGREHTEHTGQPIRQDMPALEDIPASNEWKGMDVSLADAVMSFHNRISAGALLRIRCRRWSLKSSAWSSRGEKTDKVSPVTIQCWIGLLNALSNI